MLGNPYAKQLGGKKDKDEDLYAGYEDIAAKQAQIIATVSGSVKNGSNAIMASQGMRPPTQSGNQPSAAGDAPRPMTSVKGAGYVSDKAKTASGRTAAFDPLKPQDLGPAPPLQKRSDTSPEFQAKEMEKEVHKFFEESCEAASQRKFSVALEKAKEAKKKEKNLTRYREKHSIADQNNQELTNAVLINLGIMFQYNNMYNDALSQYMLVVKTKAGPGIGRVRVNMGNIYFAQKKFPAAIKMYRMAMDQIANLSTEMRFKLMRNIGNAFVKLGQYQDAISSYESIMDAHPTSLTGFNLIVCYYALGNKELMKKGFQQLLNVQENYDDDDEDSDDEKNDDPLDELAADKRRRKKITSQYIHQAAMLIAPVLEKDFSAGFDWVEETLKAPRAANGGDSTRKGFPKIAADIEICKGISYLKKRNIKEAIEVFKGFEQKDIGLVDQAATNLSFLYYLENDFTNAEKYAELAVKADRYNAKALVNKANIYFEKGDLEAAKELYLEAIGVEADCVQAIYNLGLAYKRLKQYKDALQAFKKLHRIVPKDPQVIYHIANLYDHLCDNHQAAEWFKVLHGIVPNDPKVLARLGVLYTKEQDETAAFHNFLDSYNAYPVNMEVISWLGVWYVKGELYEDAIQYFMRAAEIEPDEVKWQLMVASCYRRMGARKQALEMYKKIHKQDPDNIECLRYLCSITKDMNDQQYEEYSRLLARAERAAQRPDNKYLTADPEDQQPAPGGAARPNTSDDNTGSANLGGIHHDIAPKQAGPMLGQAGGGKDAEDWGEGLEDDLLPL